jgi:tetratricopeptide (TPR) repeat protein
MNCPHCGAEIENFSDICRLCGTSIDKGSVFDSFIRKGDEFFNLPDYDKAIKYYNKAMEADHPSGPEVYIKLGNALDKKNDKQAAGMYLKALSYNFYNEHVHTLLIAFYDKYKRLKDLKAWYEKSRASADEAFIDNKIKTIANIVSYREKAAETMGAQAEEFSHRKRVKMANSMISGFKEYIMMNIILGIAVVVIGAGMGLALFMKINTMYVFAVGGMFFVVSAVILAFIRAKKIKEMKNKAQKPEDLLRDFIKPAGK